MAGMLTLDELGATVWAADPETAPKAVNHPYSTARHPVHQACPQGADGCL